MEPIYLDHAAATPLRPEVARILGGEEARRPANPSSPHRWGRDARRRLERARDQVADALDVPSSRVRFVRGGTEANNLAVLGRFEAARREGASTRVALSAVEHSSVREAGMEVTALGGEVVTLSVAPDGTLDSSATSDLLTGSPDGDVPALVSCMWVNHETGSILAVEDLVKECRRVGVVSHVDATQGALKFASFPLPPADLVSLSAHKLGGPLGIGILLVRDASVLHPRHFGGGQEGELRPGTEDVTGAEGTAVAFQEVRASLPREEVRIRTLRDRLEEALVEAIPELQVHGREGPRAPHLLNVGLPGLPLDLLPGALDLEGVAASAGAACRSGAGGASQVLSSLYGEAHAEHTAPLRLSLGWTTTEEEVEAAAGIIPQVIHRIRRAGIGT